MTLTLKVWFWHFFNSSALRLLTKHNNFLWVFWFLAKNLSNFVSLPGKIDNTYYHIWQSSIKLSSLFPCFTSKLVCASHPKRRTLGCRNLKTSQMQQSLIKKFVKTLVKKLVKKHKAFFSASSLHFKAGLCLSRWNGFFTYVENWFVCHDRVRK